MLEKTVDDIVLLCQRIKRNEESLRNKTFIVVPSILDSDEQIKFYAFQALPLLILPFIPICSSQIDEYFGLQNYFFAISLFSFDRIWITNQSAKKNMKRERRKKPIALKLTFNKIISELLKNSA